METNVLFVHLRVGLVQAQIIVHLVIPQTICMMVLAQHYVPMQLTEIQYQKHV